MVFFSNDNSTMRANKANHEGTWPRPGQSGTLRERRGISGRGEQRTQSLDCRGGDNFPSTPTAKIVRLLLPDTVQGLAVPHPNPVPQAMLVPNQHRFRAQKRPVPQAVARKKRRVSKAEVVDLTKEDDQEEKKKSAVFHDIAKMISPVSFTKAKEELPKIRAEDMPVLVVKSAATKTTPVRKRPPAGSVAARKARSHGQKRKALSKKTSSKIQEQDEVRRQGREAEVKRFMASTISKGEHSKKSLVVPPQKKQRYTTTSNRPQDGSRELRLILERLESIHPSGTVMPSTSSSTEQFKVDAELAVLLSLTKQQLQQQQQQQHPNLLPSALAVSTALLSSQNALSVLLDPPFTPSRALIPPASNLSLALELVLLQQQQQQHQQKLRQLLSSPDPLATNVTASTPTRSVSPAYKHHRGTTIDPPEGPKKA